MLAPVSWFMVVSDFRTIGEQLNKRFCSFNSLKCRKVSRRMNGAARLACVGLQARQTQRPALWVTLCSHQFRILCTFIKGVQCLYLTQRSANGSQL